MLDNSNSVQSRLSTFSLQQISMSAIYLKFLSTTLFLNQLSLNVSVAKINVKQRKCEGKLIEEQRAASRYKFK